MQRFSMKKEKLKREILFELDQLKNLASQAEGLFLWPAEHRRPWDAAAAAKYVSDLVLCLENMCKRRCHYLGIPIPQGYNSHNQILEDFSIAPELGGLLSPEMSQRLKKYLRFRHRFIHNYGHEVKWEMVEEPLRLLPETISILSELWEKWLESLTDPQE